MFRGKHSKNAPKRKNLSPKTAMIFKKDKFSLRTRGGT